MNFTSLEKSAIITILYSIMQSDGNVDPREQNFLDEFLREFAITIDEYTAAAHMDRAECKRIINALPEEKKNKVTKYFLDMVGVDGKVDLRELSVLHELM